MVQAVTCLADIADDMQPIGDIDAKPIVALY
jgi:hypothetical protein